MNDDPNFKEIEQRLLGEAQSLLAAKSTHPSAATLSAVFQQRKRRRAIRSAFAASGAVSLILAGLVFGMRHGASRLPMQPQHTSVADLGQKLTKQKLSILATDAPSGESLVVIPFVIGDPAAGEEVISGIYVPEQAEPMDELDFSPAERDAVRAVLGIEGQDGALFQPI
jgi:hypothetical protein